MNNLVKDFYNSNPYPCFSRFANVQSPVHLFENACDMVGKPVPTSPSILIVGCGTVAAKAIAKAYPEASNITALDISKQTIDIAQKSIQKDTRGKINWVNADIADPNIQEYLPIDKYDWIHCTGVLHHLESPESGISNISKLLSDEGVVRFQLYSKGGREWIEWVRSVFLLKEAKNSDDIINILLALSKYHPFRYVMATYPESYNKAGLMDGFLHPQVKTFYASDWNNLLKKHCLQISSIENLRYFDNLEEIFPKHILNEFNKLDLFSKITILEKLGEWRSDFRGVITKYNQPDDYEFCEISPKTDIICDIADNISYPRHFIWQETKSALKMIPVDIDKQDLEFILSHLSPRLWLPGLKGLIMRFKWASWQDMSRDLASSTTIFKDNLDDLIDDYYNNTLNFYIPPSEKWPWKQWENGFFVWDWN